MTSLAPVLIFLGGAVLSLAFPPGAHPLPGLVILSGLFLLGQKSKRPFRSGYCFALGYFMALFYWLVDAYYNVIADNPYFALAALFLFPSFFACLWGGALWAARKLAKTESVCFLLMAFFLSWAEYLRAELFHFPLNMPGSLWGDHLMVLQGLSITGIYGLNLLTFIWCGAVCLLFGEKTRGKYMLLAAIGVSFVLWTGYGTLRLSQPPLTAHQDIALRIVQSNWDSATKKKLQPTDQIARFYNKHFQDMAETPDVTVLNIGAEGALLLKNSNRQQRMEQLSQGSGPNDYTIMGGYVLSTGAKTALSNQLMVVDHTGALQASYSKRALVPWGETAPLPDPVMKWLNLPSPRPPMIAGQTPQLITVPGHELRFVPLICYDAAYPDQLQPKGARGDFILWISDDGWATGTIGPGQTAALGRLRSIEQGLPLVRAANTGPSYLIDAYGRMIKAIPTGEEGRFTAPLPKAPAPTLFSHYGSQPVLILQALLTLMIGLFARHRRRA